MLLYKALHLGKGYVMTANNELKKFKSHLFAYVNPTLEKAWVIWPR